MKKLRDNSIVLALKFCKAMNDWIEYKLGDIAVFSQGIQVGIEKQEETCKDGYVRFIRIVDYTKGTDEPRYILYPGAKYMVDETDIVMMRYGTPGKVARGYSGAIANNMFKITVNEHILIKDFAFYYLSQDSVYRTLIASNSSSTMPAINFKIVERLDISAPSLSEQKRLVEILKCLDDKIENNRRVNENLEQQAQALFKSWLKKCEDEVTIGDLSLNITDYTKCEQKQVVLINSSDVTEGRFEHHNLSENKNLKGHFKKRFQKGDILYSQVRPRNRHWGYCTFNADNYLASTQLMVIRNKPELISSILLYQYIIDDKVWLDFTLKTETRSGTFPQGNYEELSSIKVPFGAETSQISSVLENLYSRIFNNEKESNLLSSLRDTLLPKLMSGELRVPDTDLINEMLEKGIR